jgi:hypothetical protein
MTPDELQQIIGKNATFDITPQELQDALYRNATINDNPNLSFSSNDLGNLTGSLSRFVNQTDNTTQENDSSLNLLYVTCTIKKMDIGKFFENFSIPLSDCKINE